MRIKLAAKNRIFLFDTLFKKVSQQKSAASLNVSTRTIRDWHAGRSLLSEKSYNYFCLTAGLTDQELKPERRPDNWQTRKAGKLGAKSSLKLYGNPGTALGRKLGGTNSLKTHKQLKTGFLLIKNIKKPKRSIRLAEFLGILFGDGHAGGYQVSVTTNSETDYEHAIFVKELFKELFGLEAKLTKRRNEKVVTVVASSLNLVNFMAKLGMPLGNKIHSGMEIPKWIFTKLNYQKAFIRGLFDTDGCVYLEKHMAANKKYHYVCWAITSYSKNLRSGILRVLQNLGFRPTNQLTQHSVFLRHRLDIENYFKKISSSNPKHLNRYNKFTGEVA